MTARRKPAPDTAMPDAAMPDTGPPQAEPLVAMVPLSQLYLHELNTRSEPPPADIEALAESIRAIGLLQNLSGYADGEWGDDQTGRIGIVAGGRRLRALRLIAGDSDPMVPVRVTMDEATARLWASAENAARMALHPADEIAAYGKMAAARADINAIARAFAVTESHVRRRLKLASLPTPALDALRAGRISLDQAAALTVARSETDAERALNEVLTSQWPVGADRIRAMLQQATVPMTDRRAVFVGIAAYQAAGGELQADLFTERSVLLDADLLDRLFAEKLEAAAEAERARGWKWVETLPTVTTPYEVPSAGMQAVHRTEVELPEADQDELDELQRLGEVEEFTETQAARFDELTARAAGDYTDEDVATSGVFLLVTHKGELHTAGPLRRREDAPGGAQATGEDGSVEIQKVEAKALPAALLEDLYRIKRAALEAELIDCPGLMLDLLAYSLSGDFWPHQAPVMMTAAPLNITPEKADGFDAPPRLTAFTARDFGRNTPTVAGFKAFRISWDSPGVAITETQRALALAIARSIRPHSPLEAYLASRVEPKVRAIWTPTKDGFLARLPVPALDAIWAELVPPDLAPARGWSALKKADKARELHDLFNSADYREALGLSRATNDAIDAWLPPELQWPEVEGEEGEVA
jgi:ParB family transcriptional regulator, chromosome partitioning protein